jgi:hypothetical protein
MLGSHLQSLTAGFIVHALNEQFEFTLRVRVRM